MNKDAEFGIVEPLRQRMLIERFKRRLIVSRGLRGRRGGKQYAEQAGNAAEGAFAVFRYPRMAP